MASHVIRVGHVEIMALSDGLLEFDLCNFFPTIPEAEWQPYESHLIDHKVRFNLGSYLIRSDGRTILVDTLIVRWPSGLLQRRFALAADQRITIVEQAGVGVEGDGAPAPGTSDSNRWALGRARSGWGEASTAWM